MKYLLEFITALFLIVTLILFFRYKTGSITETNVSVMEGQLFAKKDLWWIVDSETNSRNWWDFGSRNSAEPNKGYLKVALECVRKTQGGDFTIHTLLGRQAVSEVLTSAGLVVSEDVNSLPVAIWRQWAIANLLAVKGGLAMMGDSTLCVGPSFAPRIDGINAATFGIYSSEASALPGSEHVGPAPWVAWAAKPSHPGWQYTAEKWNLIVNAGPTAWTAADARRENLIIWEVQKTMGVDLIQDAEGGRNPDGSERTLEDLLGREANPADPKTPLLPETVYIPFDSDALVRMHRYSWFVRMSESQIMESDFVWASLAKAQYTPL